MAEADDPLAAVLRLIKAHFTPPGQRRESIGIILD